MRLPNHFWGTGEVSFNKLYPVYRRRWLTRFMERVGMTKCAEWSPLLPAPGASAYRTSELTDKLTLIGPNM